MRPSFIKICLRSPRPTQNYTGRKVFYLFSLIYLKDIKILREMSKIIIKRFLGNVANFGTWHFE